ncbi:hypothetical protein SLA2020_036160 [Shorea laevis]
MLRNLVRHSPHTHYSAVNHRPQLPFSFRRHFSSKSELVEIDLDFSSPSGLKKMEEMIQKLLVHKAAPYWLPFIPGASFWVPPAHRGSKKVVDLIEKLSNRLTEEEAFSLTTDRGWPCLSSFLSDNTVTDGVAYVDVDMKSSKQDGEVIEVVVMEDSKNLS